MAYVSDATNPTNVEFQYYRSMNAHSSTAMGDEVYVYKLTNANGGTWSVTTRKASIKEIDVASGSKLGVSWSSDKVTLSNTMTADDMPMSSSDATTAKAAIDALNSKIDSLVHTETKTGTTDDAGYMLLTTTESGKKRYYLFTQNKTNANYLTFIVSGSTYGYAPYARVTLADGNAVANTQMELVLHYLLL